MGFTAGPWAVATDPRPHMDWNKWVKAGRQNICVLSQNHKGDFAVSEANAHLIAAAPDLAEAVAAFLAYDGAPPDSDIDAMLMYADALAKAKAALAKANGTIPHSGEPIADPITPKSSTYEA